MCCFIASLSSCSCFTPRAAQPKIGLCPFPACRDPRLGTLKLLHIRPSLGLVFSLSPFSSQQQHQLSSFAQAIFSFCSFYFFLSYSCHFVDISLGAIPSVALFDLLGLVSFESIPHLSNPFATTTTLIRLKKDFSLGRVSISFWAASFKTDSDQTKTRPDRLTRTVLALHYFTLNP